MKSIIAALFAVCAACGPVTVSAAGGDLSPTLCADLYDAQTNDAGACTITPRHGCLDLDGGCE